MTEFKRFRMPLRRRPLDARVPATIVLLSAYVALIGRTAFAQETPAARPGVSKVEAVGGSAAAAPPSGPSPCRPPSPEPILRSDGAPREQVFALAANGGARRALDEARARPDLFSALDVVRIEEASILQQVRDGRAKVQAITDADRFDELDRAILDAEAFGGRLPATPEYEQVRTALAGDLTIAYAARGRMKDALVVFEAIAPKSRTSAEVLAAAGDAYAYLQRPGKAEQVYRRAIECAESRLGASATSIAGGSDPHTRLIDLRSGLFYALTDQDRNVEAGQVLDDIRRALPPVAGVRPWDPANDDYLSYYRLRAQYQIYTGRTASGMASLQRLAEQAPFSAEVRNARADAILGNAQPRRARDLYAGSLTDHPDNIEALAGLGRTSLVLGDYDQARRIDDAFADAYPENGAVRGFRRDYAAYRAPVLSVLVNGERGNSALADSAFSLDSLLYSSPLSGNWRIFQHVFHGRANLDAGNVNRTRMGIGADYRRGPLTMTAEATRSLGGDGRAGGNGEITYAFSDYLSASASLDSDADTLPWKAYAGHLWGKSAQFSLNLTDTDQRSASLSYSAARYSDADLNQQIALSGTQRVFNASRQRVDVSMNFSTGSNTVSDAAYYAPGRDYTAEIVAMHQWAIWHSAEKALTQRIYLSVGAYNERGFGTSAELGLRLEHRWNFGRNLALTYGIGVMSHAYDGSRELSSRAYAALTVPF
ncbi:tetratricopeptide repeat protein [Burkholderia gladioli]|uniref:tetratricopeptide repeat protein n=1 Tax=Burkholderia gladioli TaxID=28095 RepID=UPI003F797644